MHDDDDNSSDLTEKLYSVKEKKLNRTAIGTAGIIFFAIAVISAVIVIASPLLLDLNNSDVLGFIVQVKSDENVDVIFTGSTGYDGLEGIYAYFDGNAPLPPYEVTSTLSVGKVLTYHFAEELKGKTGTFEIFGKFKDSEPKLLYTEKITMS